MSPIELVLLALKVLINHQIIFQAFLTFTLCSLKDWSSDITTEFLHMFPFIFHVFFFAFFYTVKLLSPSFFPHSREVSFLVYLYIIHKWYETVLSVVIHVCHKALRLSWSMGILFCYCQKIEYSCATFSWHTYCPCFTCNHSMVILIKCLCKTQVYQSGLCFFLMPSQFCHNSLVEMIFQLQIHADLGCTGCVVTKFVIQHLTLRLSTC